MVTLSDNLVSILQSARTLTQEQVDERTRRHDADDFTAAERSAPYEWNDHARIPVLV